MDHLVEQFLKDVEDTYPQTEEETTAESFCFMLAKKNLETMLFPRSPEELAAEKPLPPIEMAPTKEGQMQKRQQGLLARIRRERNREEVTRLNVSSQVERYQIITKLRAIQALKTDKEHWAYRRLEALIQRIEKGELPQAENE